MENLVETTGLCKRYEDFSLEGVNLTVPAGTIVGLIGDGPGVFQLGWLAVPGVLPSL